MSDEGYFIVKLLEYILVSIDDRGVQRILREVDNDNLAMVLKGLSIETQNIIFNNLSKRLAVMIQEDMCFIGPISTKNVAMAAQEINKTIVKLMSLGEIQDNEYQIVSRMLKVFGIDVDKITDNERNTVESELEKLFRQYKSVRNRMID